MEFVGPKERKKRIITLVVCGVISLICLGLTIYFSVRANAVENKPEEPNNLKKLRGEVAEIIQKLDAVQRTSYEYARPLGLVSDPRQSSDANMPVMSAIGVMSHFDPRNEESREAVKQRMTIDMTKLSDTFAIAMDTLLLDLKDPQFGLLKDLTEDEIKQSRLIESGAVSDLSTWFEKKDSKQVRNNTGSKLFMKTAIEALQAIAKIYSDKAGLEEAERQKIAKDVSASLGKAREEDDTATNKLKEVLPQYMSLIEQFEKESLEAFQKVAEAEAEQKRVKAEKEAEVASKRKGLQDLKKQADDLENRKKILEARLEEQKVHKEPDGSILEVDMTRNIVYINLTRKDRLFKGTRFTTFAIVKGGVRIENGEIEVIEPQDRMTVCFIRKIFPNTPMIKAGDQFYNYRYDKDKPNYIVLAGKLTKYSKIEVIGKLEEMGDILQNNVDSKTNYLIIGEGYDKSPDYQLALEFGVRIFPEARLYEYLGLPAK